MKGYLEPSVPAHSVRLAILLSVDPMSYFIERLLKEVPSPIWMQVNEAPYPERAQRFFLGIKLSIWPRVTNFDPIGELIVIDVAYSGPCGMLINNAVLNDACYTLPDRSPRFEYDAFPKGQTRV